MEHSNHTSVLSYLVEANDSNFQNKKGKLYIWMNPLCRVIHKDEDYIEMQYRKKEWVWGVGFPIHFFTPHKRNITYISLIGGGI